MFLLQKKGIFSSPKKLWIKGGGARWKNSNRTFDSHAEKTTWQTNQLQKSGKKLANK
jgi:hypothetical protein